MKKTWIFFKLRMLQLKSDKTALFFCYVLPVLLLLGIGYPLQLQSDPKITLYYQDEIQTDVSRSFLDRLRNTSMVELIEFDASTGTLDQEISENKIKRVLQLLPEGKQPIFHGTDIVESVSAPTEDNMEMDVFISKNNIDENRIENVALAGIVNDALTNEKLPEAGQYVLASDRMSSYLVTLLPGLIGMTLMIIGLNGFGGVLIEEEHRGLFKNLKTVDISPVPFLSGLFLSRLLICYSVAVALCMIASLVFDISFSFDIPLFALIVTLGSVAFLGVGLVIAAISPSTTAFNGIVNFVQLPFIILGGVFVSITKFPEWLQYICMFIPLAQLNAAMQKVLFESMTLSSIGDLGIELSILTAWCVVSLVVARLKFNW